ncbi:MAG: hypothetical protein II900_04295 [Prevotella sp.]|nr:hypothetical protein [Prevotella sp.]
MKARAIIIHILVLTTSTILSGCSTEWEEFQLKNETPSYSYNSEDIKAEIKAGIDEVKIEFPHEMTASIYLNDVFMKEIVNEYECTLYNLEPNTKYNLKVTSLRNEQIVTKSFDFTTRFPFLSLIGYREFDKYNYREDEGFGKINPYSDGGFIDYTYKYVRRTDAQDKVIWRTAITAHNIYISEDGQILTRNFDAVSKLDPQTGKIIATYSPSKKDVDIFGTCTDSNGNVIIVGGLNGKGYIGYFDAKGKIIHEEQTNLATYLLDVQTNGSNGYVAIGISGKKLVAVSINKSGKATKANKYQNDNIDSDNDTYFLGSVRDDKGNIYFIGNECVGHNRAAIVKIDNQGNIVWVKGMHDTGWDTSPTYFYLFDTNKICAAYEVSDYSYGKTHIGIFDLDGNKQKDINMLNNYDIIYAKPENGDCTQFTLFDKYGRILYMDSNGYREEE